MCVCVRARACQGGHSEEVARGVEVLLKHSKQVAVPAAGEHTGIVSSQRFQNQEPESKRVNFRQLPVFVLVPKTRSVWKDAQLDPPFMSVRDLVHDAKVANPPNAAPI